MGGGFLSDLFRSDAWLLVVLAVVIAVILMTRQPSAVTAKLAAFFEVLGDVLALLALAGTGESGTVSG